MSTILEMIAVEAGGVVREDVLDTLFNISPVERPCIDSIGSTGAHNIKKEFTDKVLSAPSSSNTTYENEDLSGVVDNNYGLRYYNLMQNPRKVVKLSQRGRDAGTTYNREEYMEQVISLADELRLDEEAAAVSRNPVTPEVANTSGALMAGMATWAIHNTQRGVGGQDAELDGATNTGGGPATAPVAGNKTALTLTMIRTALQVGWTSGARFSHMMSTGDAIEMVGNFLFDATANVATMRTDIPQGNRQGVGAGAGAGAGGVVAQGAVNMYVGNFGTVILTPNRQMTPYTAADTGDVTELLFFDSRYPKMAYLHQYDHKEIASNGLYDQEVIHCDSTFIPGATHSITTIADIDVSQGMSA